MYCGFRGEPWKTAGPILRGAARSRTYCEKAKSRTLQEEGPNLY